MWPFSASSVCVTVDVLKDEYDYIVIGGGTAGITVASRLAQNGYQVALVEAGGYYEWLHPISKIPGAATIGIGASISTASSVDWKFVAEKVPGANHRDIHYPRGKCLGGSYVDLSLASFINKAC